MAEEKHEGPKFFGKIFITGYIRVVTGLHIGGSKNDLDIGGVDLSVIKLAGRTRSPYIPGSSLKGKLRTMLAREHGSQEVKEDPEIIKEIFGYSADYAETPVIPNRLIVRDAFLEETEFTKLFDSNDLDTAYTEVKWENTINRKTGTAEHPRQIERVPAGARFAFELIYNMYKDEDSKQDATSQHIKEIIKAMHLLEDDYLGGHGTRGYGKIQFESVRFQKKEIKHYEGKNERVAIDEFAF